MSSQYQQRSPLSRDQVLRAALAMADLNGIAGLSMRKLGQDLGVEAMSLYNHVANKHDLIGGMFDLVMQEIEAPDPTLPAKAAIRVSSISAHAALRRHPWTAGLIMQPQYASEARLRWMDGILGHLRRAGCSVELTHHVYHALDSHIVGFALWATSLPVGDADLPNLAADMAARFPLASYPYLVEHMRYHMEEPHTDPEYDDSEFAFGLDLILDGVSPLQSGR